MLHVHLGWLIPSAHRTENMVIGLRMAMLAPEHVEHCHVSALTDKWLFAAHGKNMLLDRQLVGIRGLCLSGRLPIADGLATGWDSMPSVLAMTAAAMAEFGSFSLHAILTNGIFSIPWKEADPSF
ncbi:hypothetical protein [Paraburkholderia fungorum]|uniref:hypothetical protein n=1 Tax=Paraburkholderia fungorum TaxID=134537 RepID=UPI001C1E999F|nr:hypothetical protein [Paraburkholderia fungorum]MBU7443316.1 hypothetical protein [Paraburkholderia fungorum]